MYCHNPRKGRHLRGIRRFVYKKIGALRCILEQCPINQSAIALAGEREIKTKELAYRYRRRRRNLQEICEARILKCFDVQISGIRQLPVTLPCSTDSFFRSRH